MSILEDKLMYLPRVNQPIMGLPGKETWILFVDNGYIWFIDQIGIYHIGLGGWLDALDESKYKYKDGTRVTREGLLVCM